MKTINQKYQSIFKDQGSKFLGFLFPSESEDSFYKQLKEYKEEFWDATHHCQAYRLGIEKPLDFSSDDGEPSGTAGLPILNRLRSADLIDAGLIVIRYYGGTKLGKAGLIYAYGETAKLAIEEASLLQVKPVHFVSIEYDYSLENVVNKLVLNYSLMEDSAEYTDRVSKQFGCPVELADQFKTELESLSHLSIDFEMLHKSYICV